MLFKDRLAELRTAAGMTQKELAEKSGVNVGAIRNYEQGVSGERLNFSYIAKLAMALSQTCDVFAKCEDVIGSSNAVPTKERRKPKLGRPKKAVDDAAKGKK